MFIIFAVLGRSDTNTTWPLDSHLFVSKAEESGSSFHSLVKCQPDCRDQSPSLHTFPSGTGFCYLQRLHSVFLSPQWRGGKKDTGHHLEWSADLLQSVIHHHKRQLRPSERSSWLGCNAEDAFALWPHLNYSLFSENAVLTWMVWGTKRAKVSDNLGCNCIRHLAQRLDSPGLLTYDCRFN